MAFLKYISIFTVLVLLINSCSVNSNHLIQKRKYQKGFYVSVKKKNSNSVVGTSSAVAEINHSTQQHEAFNTEENIDRTLEHELSLNLKSAEPNQKEGKDVKNMKLQRVEQSFNSIKTKVYQTTQRIFPSKTINKEGVSSQSTFNSDVLTVVVMILLLAGAVLVFQLVEGSTGLLIGFILLIGVIVIMAT